MKSNIGGPSLVVWGVVGVAWLHDTTKTEAETRKIRCRMRSFTVSSVRTPPAHRNERLFSRIEEQEIEKQLCHRQDHLLIVAA